MVLRDERGVPFTVGCSVLLMYSGVIDVVAEITTLGSLRLAKSNMVVEPQDYLILAPSPPDFLIEKLLREALAAPLGVDLDVFQRRADAILDKTNARTIRVQENVVTFVSHSMGWTKNGSGMRPFFGGSGIQKKDGVLSFYTEHDRDLCEEPVSDPEFIVTNVMSWVNVVLR